MFAANTYRIRLVDGGDADALRSLADRNSQQPLVGRVLIGEIDGVGAAALSLSDGRIVADASPRIGHLVANLQVRAAALRAFESTPSLHDRLLAGLPAWYRALATATSAAAADAETGELAPALA